MAAALSIERVMRYLRIGPNTPEWVEGSGLRGDLQATVDWCNSEIDAWAPTAPQATATEAAIRLIGYLKDRGGIVGDPLGLESDLPGAGGAYMLHSGAATMLQRWHPVDSEPIE